MIAQGDPVFVRQCGDILALKILDAQILPCLTIPILGIPILGPRLFSSNSRRTLCGKISSNSCLPVLIPRIRRVDAL